MDKRNLIEIQTLARDSTVTVCQSTYLSVGQLIPLSVTYLSVGQLIPLSVTPFAISVHERF